jgi:heat shock protein HslJ
MRRLLLLFCLAFPAAAETVPGGPFDRDWQLLAMDGVRFPAEASLGLPADGEVTGKAPCNRFAGVNRQSLPALGLGAIAATRRACDALDEETRYFDALAEVNLAELRDGHLILTGPSGRVLEFVEDLGATDLVCLTCRAP